MFRRPTLEYIRPRGDLLSMEGDHASRYLWLAPQVAGLKVIDIGCGFGYGSAFLEESSAREVLGVDINPEATAFARRRYRRDGLRFETANVTADSPPASDFDAAVSFEVIEHLADPEPYLRYVRAALKPAGEFFLSTPNRRFTQRFYRDGRSRNPFHLREYYPEELAALLARDFEILGVFVQYDVRGREEQFEGVYELVDSCGIPPGVRQLVPSFVKRAYLRLKGRLPPDPRGRHADYRIEPVESPEAIDEKYLVQLYRVRVR